MVGANPRIFVGTLACGEAEFDECCAAIAAQTGVDVTHHTIRNQPEYQAHNMLWAAWNENKSTHDLFVKIDADTVLNRNTALSEIAALFSTPDVTGAQILIQDYFTDDLISGLNAFSPQVEFRQAKHKLYADHADFGHKIVLKGDSVRHLAPIAWHGKNPSPRQSFHFGFRRSLKGQVDALGKLVAAYRKFGDESRGWAVSGAASARWWMRFCDLQTRSLETQFSKMQDAMHRKEVIDKYLSKWKGTIG